MKVDVLAIGAHPDDVELSCSGTVIKMINQGKSVGLVDLTRGELGTRGNAELRTIEANNAAKSMGASFRENLDMRDGFFEHVDKNLRKIAKMIRKYQPDIVLANAVSDRHPDHGRAAKLVSDACFIAGLIKVEILDDNGQPYDRWRPNAIYHYIQDYHLDPDIVVDITDYIDAKMEAILCFKSQFYDPNSDQPESPISTQNFFESIKAKNRVFGRPLNYDFAEGFTVERTIGVKSLFDLE
jgi:bacillithiol biosynthesis deacetylase BshB1